MISLKRICWSRRRKGSGTGSSFPRGWKELSQIHERVELNMQPAMNVFVSGDADTARRLITEKERLRDPEREASDLRRINAHVAAVAYPILDASGDLRGTRLEGHVSAGEDAVASRPNGEPGGDKPVPSRVG